MKFDIHIHLAGTGCNNSGCYISPAFRKRFTYRLLKVFHGISHHQERTSIDQDWIEMINRLLKGSELDYGVVLGFDGVYRAETGDLIKEKSQMIVPSEWVFYVCHNNSNMLPGPSINPYRKDALTLLQDCIQKGAVLIKWIPAVQMIDPDDNRLTDFYAMAAKARLPLLIHMGGERTFFPAAPQFNNVSKLRRPLEAGVPVICAHTATRLLNSSEFDQLEMLSSLLQEYPHLWVDNSGLCNPGRFAHLPHLVRNELFVRRTLYGSDWPVPSNAIYYFKKMGIRKVFHLERLKNVSQRDIEIKRYFGYPEESLSNHSKVLANLDRWVF